MTQPYQSLREKIISKQAVIGVIGLGYVGLPLVRTFIEAGYRCMGFDVDQTKVDRLLAGESYIGHIEADWIRRTIAERRFDPTSSMARLAEADAIVICVPTPLSESRDPDLSYVENTAKQISAALRSGQLIVLESTTYPGTTREVVLPILEATGLAIGDEVFVAYSPEREDPGNASFATNRIPKVIGGLNEASLELADLLYQPAVVRTVRVSSLEIAEACKILENVYRAVNIAMVNELKMLFDKLGIDIWQVIDAAATKPFGFQPFYPGPGLGGHCIPIDPFYLSWLARRHESTSRFIELAGEINAGMPEWVIEKTTLALNEHGKCLKGSKIAVLGVAYKKNVDDPRESPAFRIMELLEARHAVLVYHDPHVSELPSMRRFAVPKLSSSELTAEWLAEQDCVIVVTDHAAVDYDLVARHAKLVIDTRAALRFVDESARSADIRPA